MSALSPLEAWWDSETRRRHNALVQKIAGPIDFMSPVIGVMSRHEGMNWGNVWVRIQELFIPRKPAP